MGLKPTDRSAGTWRPNEVAKGSESLGDGSVSQLHEPEFRGSNPDARPKTGTKAPTASLFGRLAKPVAGAMLAISLGTACAANGQELAELTPTTRPEQVEVVQSHPEVADHKPRPAEYQRALRNLEQWRDNRRIDNMQFERTRNVLQQAFDLNDGANLPRDHRGRIDLDVLVTQGMVDTNGREMTRGEIVMERLSQQLEYRMRVTARDLFDPNLERIEGAPGYKVLPEKVVKDLVLDALQDIPLNELNGGRHLANLVRQLPNAGNIDAENMSFRELSRAVGDANEDWLKEKFEPLIEGRELELGIVAFAAVTGIRAASPEAAEIMDGLSPRATIYRYRSDDGLSDARVRLAYRDQHVFPDLDINGQGRWPVSDTTTLRAGLTGTLSAEADDPFTATATVGSHWRSGRTWVDTSAVYRTDNERWLANISVGHYDPSTTWNLSSGLTATFGDGVAEDADGRYQWTFDATRDVEIGRAVGDIGIYAGFGVDSDGDNSDAQIGIVGRLRF